MKKAKRLLAFLLSLFLVFSIIPGNLMQVDAAKKKTVKVKTVKLNKKSVTLVVGEKITLKANLSPKKTTQKKLVWSTSNKKIATVTSKGVVKAKKKGKATITVKVKGTSKKATCKVTVKAPVKVKKVALNSSNVTLQEGSSTTLKATLTPKNTTQKTLLWTTSNKNVANVSANGVVTAVKKGTATITVQVKGTSVKSNCKVTVNAKPVVKVDVKVTNLTFAEQEKNLEAGTTYQTKLNVAPSNATNKSVVYTSSNASVASVDANGKVTAKVPGDVVITATAKDGSGKKATMKIHVIFYEIRYELTYNKDADLSAYMIGEKRYGNDYFTVGNETSYYCYNRKLSVISEYDVVGDKNKETIRILEYMPGKVCFGVSAFGDEKDTLFAKADAQVEVWKGDKKIATYKAPDKAGEEWAISEYEGKSDTFKEHNKVGKWGLIDNLWYGDLKITGFWDNEYIGKVEIGYYSIDIYTYDEDFVNYPEAYLNKLVPKYNNTKYSYEMDVWESWLTLRNENGLERGWSVNVYPYGYDELKVTKAYSTDSNIIENKIYGYSLLFQGIGNNFNKENLVIECKNPDAEFEFFEYDGYLELVITHPDCDTQRIYSIEYVQIYPDLEILDINTNDKEVARYECELDEIYIYVNKDMGWSELKSKLQIKLKGEGASWKFIDENLIKFEDAEGNTTTSYVYYYVDYDATYGDLSINKIQCSDDRFLDYRCFSDEVVVITGSADTLNDIKDKLKIDCVAKDTTWEICEVDEDSDILYDADYELILTGANGEKRRYALYYWQDLDAKYGSLEVIGITDKYSVLTDVEIKSTTIELYGTEWSIEAFKDTISIQFGEAGVKYTLVKYSETYDGENWLLTLKGSDGTSREYLVSYTIDDYIE